MEHSGTYAKVSNAPLVRDSKLEGLRKEFYLNSETADSFGNEKFKVIQLIEKLNLE